MKNLIIGFLIFFGRGYLKAQTDTQPIAGKVSYISSQNVYVKFESTKNIKAGDTLYQQKENILIPVLIVNNLSSTSCVCNPISKNSVLVSMQIYAKRNPIQINEEPIVQKIIPQTEIAMGDSSKSIVENIVVLPKYIQKISGSISASSYSNYSNLNYANTNRFQYQLSLNAKNISNSKFSVESNTSFRHEKDKWYVVQENIYQALKIYNLSIKYDNNKNTQIVLGRKINPKLSSMGAVDGIQYEGKLNNIFFGAIAGSRPDYADYSFNFKLPQFGAYAGHTYSNANGEMQNTFALIEQMNNSKTDRRFAYYQHSNSLIKNLYYFGTVEVELYKNINDKPQNTFNLSSAYLLLQYKVSKKLTLSTSYDNRKNIIYYETYKSYINQIIDIEARQGLSFQTTYYPLKSLSLGAKTGYHFPNKNSKETKNLYGFISYYNIPVLKMSVTGSANYIETSYVIGKILNLNIYRDFFKGNLYTECGYQKVNYSYLSTETTTLQDIVNLSLSWRFLNKITLSVNYEKTFENQDRFNRLNLQLRKRF
jgi:hypothetical protein